MARFPIERNFHSHMEFVVPLKPREHVLRPALNNTRSCHSVSFHVFSALERSLITVTNWEYVSPSPILSLVCQSKRESMGNEESGAIGDPLPTFTLTLFISHALSPVRAIERVCRMKRASPYHSCNVARSPRTVVYTYCVPRFSKQSTESSVLYLCSHSFPL